ncbi:MULTISPECIES: CoA transferase [unclassified Rhodococcus (in: high G+C Gram-positive bacteria)]|uniref:CoA transferase n=1 Tax=unclassified Rhodococcus (in: high G+C Gram-positive bacteria) TaxID=192944 RepID=UPI00163958FD|nr:MULTISPECIES: CoA transferase [unclassified Rhodococcus (in: high G+C Gram-positive bacteria)]MBC2644130.1 CoA transferase [Rhodococcus sp. 3A]MBC2891131.1 CoA transferase [Rhodococcus sp. 4CII]
MTLPVPDHDVGAYLAARLPVFALAAGSVAALTGAVDRLDAAHGRAPRTWRLDPERIAASFASDRLLRVSGAPVSGFAELSGFFAAADGWVRTHANYPHHRRRLLAALGLPDDAGRDAVTTRIGGLTAADVEDRAAAAQAVAVRVRTADEWTASTQGAAAASGDLVSTAVHAAGTRPEARHRSRMIPGSGPLAGVRVLDLTRVIAGPVATRTLALLGAEVLRIDPPALPEIVVQHRDTGQGKRSALLDARSADGRPVWESLLAEADVVVTGYRPGAVDGLLDHAPPHLVRGRVCAWGGSGPWAARRGFDSIVQAASGIARIEGGDTPGALPAQALDHATGYLLAAGILDALAAGHRDGRGRSVDVSLARTGAWLLRADGRTENPPPPAVPGPRCLVTHGDLATARPALTEFDDYPFPARPWGADPPAWTGLTPVP